MTLTYQEQMSRGLPRGTFDSMSDAPTASAYGVGPAWIGGRQYWSDGADWLESSPPISTQSVFGVGIDTSKPTASSSLNGYFYYATDTDIVWKIVAGEWEQQTTMPFQSGPLRLSITDFGAIGNYVYPGVGTNNTEAIQSCFDFAAAIRDAIASDASKSSIRVTVFIPPGRYMITNVALAANLSLEMADGAQLVAYPTTVDYTKPILLVGESATQTSSVFISGVNILCELFTNAAHRYSPSQKNIFACLELCNVNNSKINIIKLSGAYNNLLLSASDGLYTGYNEFYLGQVGDSCKHGVTLKGGDNTSWVNENKFFGGNFTPTSNLYGFGINSAILFTTSGRNGYTAQNNNVFFGPCFQPTGPSATYDWSSGKTGIKKHYRYNSGGYCYTVTSSGDAQVAGTTAPHLLSTSPVTVTGITKANPAVVTAAGHGYSDGDVVYLNMTSGMTQINGVTATVANKTTDTFELQGIDSTSFTTFTSGTVLIDMTKAGCWRTDSAGVTWVCEGHQRAIPVMHEYNAGSQCRIYGARHEGGTGGFAYVVPYKPTTNPYGNKADVYGVGGSSSVTGFSGSYSEDNLGSCLNYAWKPTWSIDLYGKATSPAQIQVTRDLHLKTIKGATKWCFPGFFITNIFAQTTYAKSKAPSTQHVLLEDAVKINYNDWVSFDVDTSTVKRFVVLLSKNYLDANSNVNFQALDSSGAILTIDTTNEICVNGQQTTNATAYKTVMSYSSNLYTVAAGPNAAFVRVHLSDGLSFRDVSIIPLEDFSNSGALQVVSNVLGLSRDTPRYTDGVPSVGYFLLEGELIPDISNTALLYKVVTAGALAPAYATSTTVYTKELRSNAGKIYSATSAAAAGTTSGSTAPTHSSGSVSDGTVTWKYVCAEAKLVAIGGIGTAITGSTTLTAAQIAAAQTYPASGATTITIDTAFPDGHEMVFYKTDASNTITVAGSGLTVRGTATISTQYARLTVKRSGTDLICW